MEDTTNSNKSKDGVHSTQLDPVEITTQGSRTWQWKQDFYEQNPWEDWRNKRLRPIFNRDLKERYEKAAVNAQAKKLIESTDASLGRNERFKGLNEHERNILINSPYARLLNPTDWQSFAGGASKLVQTAAGLPSSMHMNSGITGLSDEEFKESGPLDVLAPLDIPRKALISALANSDYSIGDALSGVDDGASVTEKAMTDPLNLLGIGLFSKVNKFKGLTEAQKWGNAAIGYGRNIVGNAALDVAQRVQHDAHVFKKGITAIKKNSNNVKEAVQNMRLPLSGPTKEQKKAFEEALDFNKKWYFDSEGNINPHIADVLEKAYGMDVKNIDFQKYLRSDNRLLGSSWESVNRDAKTPYMKDYFHETRQDDYAGVFENESGVAYTKYSRGMYKIPANKVGSTATHENAHAFQNGLIEKYNNREYSLSKNMGITNPALKDANLLFQQGWHGDISEFNAVQMQKRKELYDAGYSIDQIARIEDKLKKTPVDELMGSPMGRKFMHHYALPSKDADHGLYHFAPKEDWGGALKNVQELMRYSPAAAPFIFRGKSKKNPPEQ